MDNLNRPTFANRLPEKEVIVKDKIVTATLEDAITLMEFNTDPNAKGKKVPILSKSHQSSLNDLSIRDKVQVKVIGNNLIYLVDKFETLWRAKQKTEWDTELYGLMASMLEDISRQVIESKLEHKWVTPFKSRKVQNG